VSRINLPSLRGVPCYFKRHLSQGIQLIVPAFPIHGVLDHVADLGMVRGSLLGITPPGLSVSMLGRVASLAEEEKITRFLESPPGVGAMMDD